MYENKTVDLLLRIGVSFAFIYPAVSAVFNPYAWVGYFPLFLTNLVPFDAFILLNIFGAVEIIIGLWILSGKYIFYPSIIAVVMLAGIVIFNLSQMDVLFRDIPIILMAIVLAIIHYPQKTAPLSSP